MPCNYTIRMLTMDDAAEAAKLWSLIFGDEEQLIFSFFKLFSHQHTFGACAESDGKIVAAAYCPGETDYIEPDGTVHPGVYLYAVATHPDHRKNGLARSVCSLLKETAWAQGKEYLFTRPSEERLYDWYAEKLEAVPALGCRTLRFTRNQADSLPCSPLSPEAYLNLRAQALKGFPHVCQGLRWMQWEQQLHTAYGGGFFVVGDYIADIYCDSDAITVNELLPHTTAAQAEIICQTLMTVTDTTSCRCTMHGTDHYVSAAANGKELPKENPWFGPCYG